MWFKQNFDNGHKKENILRCCQFMVLTVMPANSITTKGPTRPDSIGGTSITEKPMVNTYLAKDLKKIILSL
jgi:hypothetical protein